MNHSPAPSPSHPHTELAGKVALVTGSSRGIGRAIALELARRGADIGVTFFTSRRDGQETAEAIHSLGRRTHLVRLNLNRPRSVEACVAAVREALGPVDVLVANAALGRIGRTLEVDPVGWDRTLEVNAWAFLALSRALATDMPAGGRILAVTSLGATRMVPGYGAMGPAKATLECLVRYLAVELAPRGINVNAVCPGLTDTKSLGFFPARKQMIEVTRDRTPSGRLGTPEDVAAIVGWLAGPDSDWIVGQTLVADGGYSLIS